MCLLLSFAPMFSRLPLDVEMDPETCPQVNPTNLVENEGTAAEVALPHRDGQIGQRCTPTKNGMRECTHVPSHTRPTCEYPGGKPWLIPWRQPTAGTGASGTCILYSCSGLLKIYSIITLSQKKSSALSFPQNEIMCQKSYARSLTSDIPEDIRVI